MAFSGMNLYHFHIFFTLNNKVSYICVCFMKAKRVWMILCNNDNYYYYDSNNLIFFILQFHTYFKWTMKERLKLET